MLEQNFDVGLLEQESTAAMKYGLRKYAIDEVAEMSN